MKRRAEYIRNRYVYFKNEYARLLRAVGEAPDNGFLRGELRAMEFWMLNYTESYAQLPMSEKTISF